MRIAITRAVGPSIRLCELTHLERTAIDYTTAAAQHDAYESTLAQLGCRVEQLPAEPDFPDSVFVEDAAVVFPELAILTRPGAPSRRGEVESIAIALKPYRRLEPIKTPGTLDGGDVLVVGKSVFVGLSSRSNKAGVDQLRDYLKPDGYTVEPVDVPGCLHLKSGVTHLTDDTLVISRTWVDATAFKRYTLIDVDPTEPSAACVLAIGDTVLCSAEHPLTAERIKAGGLSVVPVQNSELAKAEGGLTCCSLIIND